MSNNSVKYTISVKNNLSGDIAVLQEAYAISLAGPLKPDLNEKANQVFVLANITRKWNVTIEDCYTEITEGEWVGSPNIIL